MTDAGLALLREWKKLRGLDVRGTKVTDAGLANFKGCKELELLNICHTRITDAGLAHFKDCKNLAYLDLIDAPITDAGLAQFEGSKQLTHVIADGTEVTDAGLAHLKNCRNLTQAQFGRTKVTEAGLAHLKDCALQKLFMDETVLADPSVDALGTLYRLKFVSLKSTKLTEAGIKKLAAVLPFCTIEWNGGIVAPKTPNATLPVPPPARVDADRLAAEWVLSLGGNVTIRSDGLESRVKAAKSLPRQSFALVGVELKANPKFTNAGMACFDGCSNLVSVAFLELPITDEGLSHLRDAADLRSLAVGMAKITDAGLAVFAGRKKLESVNLNACRQFTGTGLNHLKDSLNLKDLGLSHTGLTDEGMAVVGGFKNLRVLSMAAVPVTDAGMAHVKSLPNLTSINLYDCLSVGDETLAHLRGHRNIESLNLWGTRITDAGLANHADWPRLKSLSLAQTKTTEAALSHLPNPKKLEWLELSGSRFGDAGLEALAKFSGLKRLGLQGGLWGANVTSEFGMAKLAKALPACKIEWDGSPDRRAAEYILSIGGGVKVRIDDDPDSIDPFAKLPKQPIELTEVRLGLNKKATDAALAVFRGCRNLKAVFLDYTPVTDAGLANFRDSKGLEELSLNETQVGDEGMAHFAGCKNLTGLRLLVTQVGDRGLVNFKDCAKLRTLHLWGTSDQRRGARELRGLLGDRVADRPLPPGRRCGAGEFREVHETEAGRLHRLAHRRRGDRAPGRLQGAARSRRRTHARDRCDPRPPGEVAEPEVPERRPDDRCRVRPSQE